MALNDSQLKSDINDGLSSLFNSLRDATADSQSLLAEGLAKVISEAVANYIKTADVKATILSSEIVVVGSPSTQTNASPITIVGSKSGPHIGGLS